MMTRISKALACGLGALLFSFIPLTSQAQAIYGSINGTVTDNTGAIVPNAAVTVTSEAKGTAFDVVSNAAGEYSVQHLIPDVYDVKVVVSGFQTAETKGIQVFADSSPKVDVQLVVGAAATTVEVDASAVPELKTDKADVSTEFTSNTINNVPLPNRNFTTIQLLLPGAQQLNWAHASDENPQGSSQIQVDGQAFGGVAYQLDGTDNQDPILGIIVINPPLDALAETKITTQNFDAEFGKAVSSVIVASVKSGSNTFHGSAFDYRESNANLAREPYSQFPGTVFPPGLKNQFGGSIGGPILKDRLFFFADYQGVRQKVGTVETATVPSAYLTNTCLGLAATSNGVAGCDFSEYATYRGGAGSQLIYDNSRGLAIPFAGNVIPAGLVSPQALNLLKMLQPYAPNTTGLGGLSNNYSASGTGLFNNNQWDERVDWQANQKMHVFERFSRFTSTLTGTTIYGAAGGPGFGISGYGGDSSGADDSLAAGLDLALNATLLTDFRVGYYRYNVIDVMYDQNTPLATNLGIPNMNLGTTDTSGAPYFNIADLTISGANGPNNPTNGGAQYGSGLNLNRCNCPLTEREDQYQIVNNWTKVIGNHTIKFGADLRYARNLRVPSDQSRVGILNIGSGPTSDGNGSGGLGLATFLLGDVTQLQRYVSTSTNAKEFQKRFFFYGQDSWHPNPKLTINVGLRYEFYFPETVNAKGNGALMNLDDGYIRVAGYGNIGSNMNWSLAPNAWNPRVGITYQLDDKTVIRSGYGRSFDIGVFGSIFGHVVTQTLPVLAKQAVGNNSSTASAFNLAQGPPLNVFPAVPADGLLPAPNYNVSTNARPNSLRLPTLDAWNLSVQRSITPTLTATLAYVGNKGTHTLGGGDSNNTNPNEPGITLPASDSIIGQTLHFDPSVPGNKIGPDGGVSNTNYLQRYYGGTLPACQDPVYATPTNEPGIQPGMCGWSQGVTYYSDNLDTHYNAMQATLAKQFTKGLSFNLNYAWQHAYNYNSGYSSWDKKAVYGRDEALRQNQIVGYGVWELPFGKKGMYATNVPTWADYIIGGWQWSPVMNWATGLPFTLGYGECGSFLPGGGAPCYVNGNGSFLKTSLSGFNATAHSRTYYQTAPTPLYNAKTQTYTNYQGFSASTLDQIGSAGRDSVFGPHVFTADMSLQKTIPIWESVTLKFRMDAYNVFNHINAGNPGGSLDQGGSGNITAGPFINGSTNPRQLQFSFRIDF
jgi:Carboxypeptidase regulatory-like domain